MIVFFLLSLLTVFRAPANFLWYVSILVTELSWIFFTVVFVLFLLPFRRGKYSVVSSVISLVSMALFAIPVIGAYRIAPKLKHMFTGNINTTLNKGPVSSPFSLARMITGINVKPVAYKTFTYDAAKGLTLDFYAAPMDKKRTCVIVVHGGSWAGGDSRQLPELNSALAKEGYHVASINYRLAPHFRFPAPIEDLKAALTYLRSRASGLLIDTNKFVLLGRSAGGQIVLSAAYTLSDTTIKGVISFYGPADMVWGYANPTSPLVLNSRKVMENYLGGTYKQLPQQYIHSSATETATSRAVPALLIYGENDPLVSHLHAVKLGSKLDRLGVPHHDVYLPWATHAFDWTLNGPGGQLSTWCVMRFLEKV
jgi:acetyl esterase/lipase